jgi:polar amino acid transport system substrate-binding protein
MIVIISERYFQWLVGYHSIGATLVVAFLIAIFFNPLRSRIQTFVDRTLFRATPAELAAENKRLMDEVTQLDKLKAVATLTAGMAHEIKNPLTAVKTFVEYVPERHNEPAFRESFSRIVPKEVTRIHALVQRLLDFAKPSPANKRLVRISVLLDETLEFLSAHLLEKRIQVIRSYSECDSIEADPSQMKQVFLNLLLNSIDAMDKPGTIGVSTIQEDGHLSILVTDTGRGISKKDLDHVSDPFYTTKPNGTGLGLSIVRNIIQEYNGRMTIDSLEGVGTTIRIALPLVRAEETNSGDRVTVQSSA